MEDFKISTDPLLIDKTRDVVGLYLAPPADAAVFAVDEKPQIQARQRTAPVLPMVPGTPERRSFDYVRHGTVDLFAALNTATGAVIGRLYAQHRAVDFRDFLDEIDRQTDHGEAVHVICDNLSTHKASVVHRWLVEHPRFHLHLRLVDQSNERWFAELERRCLERGVFCSLSELKTALENWIKTWNNNVKPSPGPRPPIRSSTVSAVTAQGSPDQLTSRSRTELAARYTGRPFQTRFGRSDPDNRCADTRTFDTAAVPRVIGSAPRFQ